MTAFSTDAFRARRWWILATVLIGSIVGTFSNSMAGVALPSIMQQFHIDLNLGVWVVSSYNLIFATLMPVFGRLEDMFGYKRISQIGMVGFVVCSVLAALSPSAGWLILFRVLCGVFNAPVLPAVMGIIALTFPSNERGGAMGLWATVNAASHGLGPAISGILVQYFGWPAIFWFNAVLATAGVVMLAVFVPADHRRATTRFDLVGAFTLTLAATLFMFNLTQGLQANYTLAVNLALWAACAAALIVFLVSQTRIKQPFVDLSLFAQKGFGIVTFVSSMQLFCLFGMNLVLPQFLTNMQNRPFSETGLLIAPLALTLAVTSPGAGRLSDRVGSRMTCIIGMFIVALAGLGLVLWTPGTHWTLIVFTLAVLGFGMGLTQSPTANAVTLVVGRERLGVALGIFNMLRFVSGALGTTVFGVVLERGTNLGSLAAAYRLDFYVFAAAAVIGALAAFGMPGAPARQPAQQAEQQAS
jgi:EmrB/QacA subfamily drug resistance transporter